MKTLAMTMAGRVLRVAGPSFRHTQPSPFLRISSASHFRPLTTTCRRQGSQGYGDGDGDPVGSNPQDAPATSSAQSSREHPGPESPSSRDRRKHDQSNGRSAEEAASAASGGSRSKEAVETGSSPTAGRLQFQPDGSRNGSQDNQSGGEGGNDAQRKPQPKIYDQDIHGVRVKMSKEKQEEVDQHNAEFNNRYDQAVSVEETGKGDKESQN